MLTKYLHSALRQAKYEILPDDGTYYGQIPGFDGVWANAPTLEQCREQLEEVQEEWVLLGVSHTTPLPVIDGIELRVRETA